MSQRTQTVLDRSAERLNVYANLLNDLPSRAPANAPLTNVQIDKILLEMTSQCRGLVLYTIHVVDGVLLHCEHTGPSDDVGLRTRTQDTPVSEGCIGKLLSSGRLYRIIDNVDDKTQYPEYISAAPGHTVSEMIIRVPAISLGAKSRIINLESNVRDAFDTIDAIAFCVLAHWMANVDSMYSLTQLANDLWLSFEFVVDWPLQLADALTRLATTAKAFIPFDALAVVSFYSATDDRAYLHVDHHIGHDLAWIKAQHFDEDPRTFSRAVLDSQRTLEADIEKMDSYDQRRFRRQSHYSVGTMLPHSGPESARSALILEFDLPQKDPGRAKVSAETLAGLFGIAYLLSEQRKSITTLQRAVSILPSILDERGQVTVVDHFSRTLKVLCESLHCTGCALYRVNIDAIDGNYLHEEAFYRVPDALTEPNARWLIELNRAWKTAIRETCQKKRYADISWTIDQPSSGPGPRFYRLFARPITFDALEADLLFVSFKSVDEDRMKRLHMTEESLRIVDMAFALVNRAMETMRNRKERESAMSGLSEAIGMLLEDTIRHTSGSLTDKTTALFRCVHSFLERWSPIQTRHSAIFLREQHDEHVCLKMEATTIRHLRQSMSPTGNTDVLRRGLEFSLADDNPLMKPGLTVSVWRKHRSIVSFSVERDGDANCMMVWDAIVGSSAQNRFFAGAMIQDIDHEMDYGVLTVNGTRPTWVIGQVREAEWQLSHVLEKVGAALGKALWQLNNQASNQS